MNRREVVGLIVGVALVVVLIVVTAARWHTRVVELDSGYRPMMGTLARVVAVAADTDTAVKAVEQAFAQLRTVDELMSDYKTDSELSRVNRLAFQKPVEVSEPTFDVLEVSLRFSRLTRGAFDITVGPLVDLFRTAEQKGIVPSEDEIERARERVGYEKLELDEQNRTVRFAVDGMRLDLGGIAKGYAMDKAVEAAQRCGALGAMVDVGGDVRCFGRAVKGRKTWLIGIQDPNDSESFLGGRIRRALRLTDKAVATSGDYRRFVTINGKRYSHIMNRKTGTSAKGLSSVTIIAENATEADALATAVSVMGADKGLELVEKLDDVEAILIPSDKPGVLVTSSGASKYLN